MCYWWLFHYSLLEVQKVTAKSQFNSERTQMLWIINVYNKWRKEEANNVDEKLKTSENQ